MTFQLTANDEELRLQIDSFYIQELDNIFIDLHDICLVSEMKWSKFIDKLKNLKDMNIGCWDDLIIKARISKTHERYLVSVEALQLMNDEFIHSVNISKVIQASEQRLSKKKMKSVS
ncbi:MAG: hypothetical protein KDH96_13130 [Candidatus Riesia sp.]|nr:hypothetical protein [Candidatus Riesia sp.]